MPKKPEVKGTSTGNFQQQFVKCELPKETKESVKSWDPKYEKTLDGLDRLVMDGYKISLAFDKYHDCVGAFCSMVGQGHKHAGWCLTARGPNFLSALKVLIFKHFTVLQEDWLAEVDQAGSRDDWG